MSFNDTAFVPFNGNSDSTLWKILSQMRTDSNEQTLNLFLVMFVMKGFLSFPIKTAEDKDKKIGKLCNPKYLVVWKLGNFRYKKSLESTKDKENAGQHPYLNCSEALRLKLSEWSTNEYDRNSNNRRRWIWNNFETWKLSKALTFRGGAKKIYRDLRINLQLFLPLVSWLWHC